jgi:short-subunit dehydrogenase
VASLGLHVLVTGASSGIGTEVARAFHQAGHRVTLVARRKELLDTLAAELKERCHVATVDLAKQAADPSWLGAVEAAQGPVDVLVNNAGMQWVGPTAAIPAETAQATMMLNLVAPTMLTRAVLPGMLKRGTGTIVDIASMAGVAPARGMSWYAASKAGLVAFSESLRLELEGSGVHVVTVFPGPVETPMAASAREALGKAGKVPNVPHGDPRELAVKIRDAVEQKQPRVVYPWFHRVRFVPWFGKWMTARAAPKVDPRGS